MEMIGVFSYLILQGAHHSKLSIASFQGLFVDEYQLITY